MVSAIHLLLPILAAVVYEWTHIAPKINWAPKTAPFTFDACPSSTKEKTIIFGGTSMLGRYIVDTYSRDQSICLINFGRSKCPKCHVNVKGDLRDTRHVWELFKHYTPETVLASVKPPLLGIHYRTYIELNLLAMLEMVTAAKRLGVKNFIYVSSIAAGSHYLPHNLSTEAEDKPLYTDYEAPYDVSKRVAEDRILELHEEGKFNSIAIRTSGIIGGEGDPYDYFRLPFIISFDTPAVIDCNYAANIGDALYVVDRKMKKKPSVGGQMYYYTGEHNSEADVAGFVAKASGKPIIKVPYWVLTKTIDIWTYFRWDHDVYTTLDLMRMAVVPQTFNQEKFHTTFPEFKPKFTMEETMEDLYGTKPKK